MKKTFHPCVNLALLAAFGLALAGCGNDGIDDKILPGERLSVLAFQRELEPDAVLSVSQMSLPEPWQNQFWPQAGGYPNHAMGHLALGPALEKAWDSSIGKGGNRNVPLLADPVVADGTVFTLDVVSRLSAFDAAKGREKWSVSLVPDKEKKQPMAGGGVAHAGGRLYATTPYSTLVAVDPANGHVFWQKKLPSIAHAAPTVTNDRIIVVTIDNRLFCLDAASGEPLWNYAGVPETTTLLGGASPAIDQSVAVAAFSSGELAAFRIENGSSIWSDNLANVRRALSPNAIADIRALPVVDRGMVFAVSYNGRMVAIDLRTGERVWQRDIGGAEMPFSAGDTVFVLTGDQQLAALARETGGIRWISSLPAFENPKERKNPIVWTGPVLAGGRLIVASSHGQVAEIDPATGRISAQWKGPGPVLLSPVVADNTLYLLSEGGTLAAYR